MNWFYFCFRDNHTSFMNNSSRKDLGVANRKYDVAVEEAVGFFLAQLKVSRIIY